jgi:hypothetical protein
MRAANNVSAHLVVLGAGTLMVLCACVGATPMAAAPASPAPSPEQAIPSPAPRPPAPATSRPSAPAPRPPSTIAVRFAGLPFGTYHVHLHRVCSGNQAFHITIVPSLSVSRAGTGVINVASSYFGRGLCLIVYRNASLSIVLTLRPI